MHEQSRELGAGLVGTLCLPDSGVRVSRVGVVLFNAGVVHRIGPHRVNVKLARALAEHGVPSIRLDLHGLGDSAPASAGLAHEQQVVADLRLGIDELQQAAGTPRVSMLGFCSGVLPSVQCAQRDPRVVQVLLYDGINVSTPRARRRHLLLRLRARILDPRSMLRLAHRVGGALRHTLTRGADFDQEPGLPRAAQIAPALTGLVARGVDVVVLHAGADYSEVNDPRQAERAFAACGVGGLRFEFLDTADHVLTSTSAQRLFVDTLRGIVLQAAADVPARPAMRPAEGVA